MKPLYLPDLQDMLLQSRVLHLALLALAKSPLALPPTYFCRLFDLHHSELARMRWLHRRSQYRPYVSRKRLAQVVSYLLAQFPTMLVARTTRGAIVVRVYKRYGGKRLIRTPARLPPPAAAVQQPLRRGSTRWFLESESTD